MADDSLSSDDDAEDLDEPAAEQAEALDLSGAERRLVTQPYDLGVKNISRDIEQGRIQLAIEYQRKYVWDPPKASRLIESLLLNVPIPVCYFAEDESGAYEVIDGLQRLTTIRNFLDGAFALTGLSVLSELDNKYFKDLAPRDQRRLENRTIRCIVITEDSHPDIKFDVFERLNTGAAMLTAQELRNSVYRGALNDELKRIVADERFQKLLGSPTNKRMDSEELVLRYFALTEGLEAYKPPLRQFLNEYMRTHRQAPPDTIRTERFLDCCETVHDVFGPTPFRTPGSRNLLNKAMFDALMVPVAFADREMLRMLEPAARELLADLPSNEDFVTAIGRATADRQRMLYRIGLVAHRLRTLGVDVAIVNGLGLEDKAGGNGG